MVDADAIVNACRKVIEGSLGTIRTVTASTYQAQGFAGLGDETIGLRARVKPRYDVQLDSWQRTGDIGNEMSSRGVFELLLTIKLYWSPDHQVREDQRRAIRAIVFEGIETVRRALAFPGNLTTDGTSQTGIISGCLMGQPSNPARVVREDWENRIIEADLPMRALVMTTLVTS